MESDFSLSTYLLSGSWECIQFFWPVLVIVFITSVIVFVWARAEAGNEAPSFLLLFSFLGATIGILTGWSSSPVVGTTITATLGLIGGFSVYLVARKEYPRVVTSSAIFVLSLLILIGTYLGGLIRRIEVQADREYEE